jgi:Tfp pilus assembly protein PilN
MIKINLLGTAPPPSSKMPTVGGPPAPTATLALMFVGALIICFGIVGIIYKIWSNQIADLEKARSREKIRQTELAVVRAQNEKYQLRLSDLETRINTIQALQNSRVGPVELMSSLGDVVSKFNDVYLTSLAPVGDRIVLKGQSNTVDAVADFMADLQKSGFYNTVQLDQLYQDDQHEHLTYKFSLSCNFRSSTEGASLVSGVGPTLPGGTASMGGPGASGMPGVAQGVRARTTRLAR